MGFYGWHFWSMRKYRTTCMSDLGSVQGPILRKRNFSSFLFDFIWQLDRIYYFCHKMLFIWKEKKKDDCFWHVIILLYNSFFSLLQIYKRLQVTSLIYVLQFQIWSLLLHMPTDLPVFEVRLSDFQLKILGHSGIGEGCR